MRGDPLPSGRGGYFAVRRFRRAAFLGGRAFGHTGRSPRDRRGRDRRGLHESLLPVLGLQIEFFKKHLALAARLDKPVIVHSRGCEQQTLDLCVSSHVRRAVFHCYTGDETTMKAIADAGYFVSFSGIVTFAKSPLVSLATRAQLDSLLIETDTPYLAPVPHRGKPNQPAWVVLVGRRIAELRKMDEEEFADAVERNFDRAFELG